MTFDEACKAKFESGKLSHPDQVWGPSIDYREEIRGECCDLSNYSQLLSVDNPQLAQLIRWTAEEIWLRMGDNPVDKQG